ncbi:MAG: polyprenyl synthetase family protein [Myxococcota bacterium]
MSSLSSETDPARPRTQAPAAAAAAEGADPRLAEIKALMLKLAAGRRFERLGAIVQEHLFTGGKRLRAKLALASMDALGADAEAAVGWAASCELLHNASLIHDDLQDSDPVRRGHFTVWVRHGQSQAINAGDLLLMLPYVALEHVECSDANRWHLTRAIARRAEDTVRGQSLEMCLLDSGQWDWQSYVDASCGKTSALMALPVHGAALLAGRDPGTAEALADAFKPLGLLFQIQDDVLDLYGDKGRGEPGGDIREGRVSALVSEHLRLHPSDEKWLVGILARAREETSGRDVERVAERFRAAGTLDAVLDRIRDLADGIENAEILVQEPGLRAVALELVERSLDPIRFLMKEKEA